MTDRIPEPTTAAELARMSPQERWQLDQQSKWNPWTDPTVLMLRDPITGGVFAKPRT